MGGISYRLSPLERDIIALLRDCRYGMDIVRIEEGVGRERHDPEVLRAITRLKSFGIIRRKGTSYNHLVLWILM